MKTQAVMFLVLNTVLLTACTASLTYSISNLFQNIPKEAKIDFNPEKPLKKRAVYYDGYDECNETRKLTWVAALLQVHMKEKATSRDDQFVLEMDEIRTTAKELLVLFKKIKSSIDSAFAESYPLLRKASKETNNRLEEQLKKAKKDATTCILQELVDIEVEAEELQREMKKLLLISKNAFMERGVLLMISTNITQGNIDAAVESFSGLDNESLVGAVIAKAYNDENVQHILKFIMKLPSSSCRINALEKLGEEVNLHDDKSTLKGSYILSSTKILQSVIKNEVEIDLDKLLHELLSMIESIDDRMEQKPKSNYQNIIELENKKCSVDELMNQIINTSLGNDQEPSILHLIQQLPVDEFSAKAYNKILEEEKARHYTYLPMDAVVYRLTSLQKEPSNLPAKCKPLLKKVQTQLSANVLNLWGRQIQSNNFEQILEFSSKHGLAFINYTENLVNITYQANDSAIMKILALAERLPTVELSASFYIELYNHMDRSKISFQPIFRFAYQLNNILRLDKYQNADKNYKKKLIFLWERLPKGVQALVSGEHANLKTPFLDKHLFVPNYYDSDRAIVSLGNISEEGISSTWIFEAEEDEKGELISYIKTKRHQEDYLYAASSYLAFNADKRRLLTRRDSQHQLGDEWEVEDFDWKNGKFYLRNRLFNEYLNNGAYTWRSGGRGEAPLWVIEPAP